MAKHASIVAVIGLTAVVLGGYFAYSYVERSKTSQCGVCLRHIHEGQTYDLYFADGTEKTACCPRCGIRDQLQKAGQFVRARATDQFTKERIEAEKACYVEGSDAHYCALHSEPLREPGTAYTMSFDRCLPSLVAFRTKEEAQVFQGRHGGRVISYQEAIESVKRW